MFEEYDQGNQSFDTNTFVNLKIYSYQLVKLGSQ